jgi:hypothetical protein
VAASSSVLCSSPRQAMEMCDEAGEVLDLSQLSCADKADDAPLSSYDSILRKRELSTLQSSLHDARAECMSKTAQLEEAKREAAEYFSKANQLKAKERNAVDLKRQIEYQLKTANAKNARLEKQAALYRAEHAKTEELLMELQDGGDATTADTPDMPWKRSVDGTYSAAYFQRMAALYTEGFSTRQVRVALATGFETNGMAVECFDIPSETYMNKVRVAAGFAEDVFNGLRIGNCSQILQLCHDGSALDGTDTFCIGVVIKNCDITVEKLVLSSSMLPRGKSSQEEYEGILTVFQRMSDKVSRLRTFMLGKGMDPDDYGVCQPLDCSLAKTLSTMNDNAATAKATANLVNLHVQNLITTLADGRAVTTEEFFLFTCWAHIRNLLLAEGSKMAGQLVAALLHSDREFEVAFTDTECMISSAVRGGKIEHVSTDSLINSIQKLLSVGKSPYVFGCGNDFKASVLQQGHTYRDMGRAGLGSRHDIKHESCVAIYMMLDDICPYVSHVVDTATDNKLSRLIRDCLVQVPYVADLRVRAILWERSAVYVRYLCQAIIDDWEIYDMADLADHLLAEYSILVNNPSLIMSKDYQMFTLEKWPQLTEFRQRRHDPNVDTRLFDSFVDDNMQEHVPNLATKYAIGAVQSIKRNMANFLTDENGIYCAATWTQERKDKVKGLLRTNIQLAEAPFGLIDRLYHVLGPSTKIYTLNGIANAKANGTYSTGTLAMKPLKMGKVRPQKPKAIKERFCIEVVDSVFKMVMIDKNFKAFDKQCNEDRNVQLTTSVARKADVRAANWAKLVRKQQDITAYHDLQRVETIDELARILFLDVFLQSEAKALEFVKNQIKIYVLGYCLTQFKVPFSKKGDASVGTLADLTAKLKIIIEKVRQEPQLLGGHVPNLYTSRDSDYNAECTKQCELYKRMKAEELATSSDQQHTRYAVRIQMPWSLVRTQKWPLPIPVSQEKLVVNSVFVARNIVLDTVRMYRVVGWMWSPSRNDYRIYYYAIDSVDDGDADAPVVTLDALRIDYTYAAEFQTVFSSVNSINAPEKVQEEDEVEIVIE